jgi:hypothetical protein
MSPHGALVLWLAPSLLLAAAAGAQTPNGPEFQVNAYTTGAQWRPDVALDGSGHMVVCFSGPASGDDGAVLARRITSAGVPLGPEFRVNAYTTGAQDDPAVAAGHAGSFVVTWTSAGQDGSDYGVFGQRFDASGAPAGPEFRVNVYTTGRQYASDVAMDAAGNFVVVWQGGDGYGSGVYARRYDVTAGSFGPEFRVNAHTTGLQSRPAVAMAGGGSFVVAWFGAGPGDTLGIFMQPFDALVNPVFASDVVVAGSMLVGERFPSVSAAPDGTFVVVWEDSDGSGTGVSGQSFGADGFPISLEFAVNAYLPGDQLRPKVAVDGTGSVMVTWWNAEPPATGGDTIRANQIEISGTQMGEFGVNSYVTGDQTEPVVAVDRAGQFVVVWQSTPQDGSEYGVFGQRYGDLIFADTFDSGGAAFWSSAAAGGGDLSVSAGAALGGSAFGLQAVVNDTAGLFVQDDAPSDEDRYRARFYFDPNGFDPGVAQAHLRTRVFIGFEEAPNRRLFAVVLRLLNGQYALMGRARRDDNSQANTGFFPITDAPHYVELDWRRSSGPDALDGTFQMWIDGVSVSTLTGLDNSVSALDFVRLGALSVKTGASGTLLYDEFVSRRTTFIGGLP